MFRFDLSPPTRDPGPTQLEEDKTGSLSQEFQKLHNELDGFIQKVEDLTNRGNRVIKTVLWHHSLPHAMNTGSQKIYFCYLNSLNPWGTTGAWRATKTGNSQTEAGGSLSTHHLCAPAKGICMIKSFELILCYIVSLCIYFFEGEGGTGRCKKIPISESMGD